MGRDGLCAHCALGVHGEKVQCSVHELCSWPCWDDPHIYY